MTTPTSTGPKVTIENFTSDSNREAEISVLIQIATSMPTGSFLAGLFSEELVQWATHQAYTGGTLDIMAWYQAEKDHRINERDNRLCVEWENAHLRDKLEKSRQDYARDIKTLAESALQERASNTQVAEEVNRLMDRIATLESELVTSRLKVIELKVKLYDLQNPYTE